MARPKLKPAADPACNPPLCIRHLVKLMSPGRPVWRFDLTWRTSTGLITTTGWRYDTSRNRIDAPASNNRAVVKYGPDVKAAIRRLLTRVLLESRGVTVEPLRRQQRRPAVLPAALDTAAEFVAGPAVDNGDPELVGPHLEDEYEDFLEQWNAATAGD